MINDNSIENPLSMIIDEAVARHDDHDPANAIALVVQETNTNERDKALQAVADNLSADDLSREDRRELFLINRAKQLEGIRRQRRMGVRAIITRL